MENSKDIGWYLDMDCACGAFSLSVDTVLALSCCLLTPVHTMRLVVHNSFQNH